jgi:hypothetical protein
VEHVAGIVIPAIRTISWKKILLPAEESCMAQTPISASSWTDSDTEAMFAAVGKYLIIFQWIEGKLDQILLLGWGYENWIASQAKLAKMSNFEKVNTVRELVFSSPDFARVYTRPDWCADFERLIGRLHDERSRRNSIVHSQYLFEFTDIGLPPLRSLRIKRDGSTAFDQQDLTRSVQIAMMNEISQLAMDINFLHIQLIHDYQAPIIPPT